MAHFLKTSDGAYINLDHVLDIRRIAPKEQGGLPSYRFGLADYAGGGACVVEMSDADFESQVGALILSTQPAPIKHERK